MATLRDIRRRIAGVKSTQQITKAMKMVAAAKLRKAQEAITSARPYARKISGVVGDFIAMDTASDNPLLKKREVNNVAVVVVTADRGLCGSFNVNIIKEATALIEGQYAEYTKSGRLKVYPIGKKGLEYFSRRHYPMINQRTGVFSHLSFPLASSIAGELVNLYLTGQVDKVLIVYNEFKSVIQQKVVVETFLPIETSSDSLVIKDKTVTKPAADTVRPASAAKGQPKTEETHIGSPAAHSEYIYEPDKTGILNRLLPKHLNSQVWRILLESNAAEQGAKMTAMDMATENAKELIRTLQITYNKERQSAITKEILEIVSGANALKGS